MPKLIYGASARPMDLTSISPIKLPMVASREYVLRDLSGGNSVLRDLLFPWGGGGG